ncbi:MAG: type II toxin-antitoxin system VapC family toxin [Pseudomonadota bacterium]
MIVIDASVVLELLLKGQKAAAAQSAVAGYKNWAAPHLLDVEVVQVLRRFVLSGECDSKRAEQSLNLLSLMPITRYTHQPLVRRVWAWRENLTAYDASYVALAEALGCPLVTRDKKLAASAQPIAQLI